MVESGFFWRIAAQPSLATLTGRIPVGRQTPTPIRFAARLSRKAGIVAVWVVTRASFKPTNREYRRSLSRVHPTNSTSVICYGRTQTHSFIFIAVREYRFRLGQVAKACD